MTSSKRPVTVMVIASLYILVGTLGLIFHFPELLAGHRDGILIELVESLAIVSGVFLLRAQNWARWLAIAWMALHVILSLHSARDLVIHSLIFALITWLLLRADARQYFGKQWL
jgi:hypothetical protein